MAQNDAGWEGSNCRRYVGWTISDMVKNVNVSLQTGTLTVPSDKSTIKFSRLIF
jgi:hypothetical protein